MIYKNRNDFKMNDEIAIIELQRLKTIYKRLCRRSSGYDPEIYGSHTDRKRLKAIDYVIEKLSAV